MNTIFWFYFMQSLGTTCGFFLSFLIFSIPVWIFIRIYVNKSNEKQMENTEQITNYHNLIKMEELGKKIEELIKEVKKK